MRALLLATVAFAFLHGLVTLPCYASNTPQTTGLFADKLPFRVINVSPPGGATLLASTSVSVIFSRPVIALGQDLGVDAFVVTPFHFRSCVKSDDENNEKVNVPGTVRWVTTSMARFDPDMSTGWPSDLCLQLVINTELSTHDGTRMKLPLSDRHMPDKLLYRTDILALGYSTVSSKDADRASDGHWTSTVPGSRTRTLECPPDAVLAIQFTKAVDPELIAKQLTINQKTPKSKRLLLKTDDQNRELVEKEEVPQLTLIGPCSGEITSNSDITQPTLTQCVQFNVTGLARPPNDLEASQYLISLPTGSIYAPFAGPTTRDLTISISGLNPFKFYFKQNNSVIRARNVLLELRRGLGGFRSGSMLYALRDSIVFDPPVEGGLIPKLIDNGTLMLTGKFTPSTTYQIKIRPVTTEAVLDGFGLKLVETVAEFSTASIIKHSAALAFDSDTVNLLTSSASDETSKLGPTLLANGASLEQLCIPIKLSDDQAMDVPLGVRLFVARGGTTDSTFRSAVNELDDSAYTLLTHDLKSNEPAKVFDACEFKNRAEGGLIAQIRSIPEPEDQTQLNFVSSGTMVSNNAKLSIVQTNRGAQGGRVTFWVSGADGRVPIDIGNGDIRIQIYATRMRMESNGKSRVVASVVSYVRMSSAELVEANGLVDVDVGAAISKVMNKQPILQLMAVAQVGDSHALFLPIVQKPSRGMFSNFHSPESRIVIQVVSDRSIYTPGDDVHIKLYVRHVGVNGGANLTLPSTCQVDVRWDDGTKTESFTLPINSDFGSSDTIVTVPEGAKFGPKVITVFVQPTSWENDDGNDDGTGLSFKKTGSGSVTVIVADPRIPSAILSLSSDAPQVLPFALRSPELTLSTITYSKVPIQDAQIQVDWTVSESASFSVYDSVPTGRGRPSHVACESLSGHETIVTEAKGEAKFTIDFEKAMRGKLLQQAATKKNNNNNLIHSSTSSVAPTCALRHGSTINIIARYNGPTGEELSSELNIGVHSLRSVRLQSPLDPVPGVPFLVSVKIADLSPTTSACCDDSTRLDCLACQEGSPSVAAYCEDVISRSQKTNKNDNKKKKKANGQQEQIRALCAQIATVKMELKSVGVGSKAWELIQSLDPDNSTLAQVTITLQLQELEQGRRRIECDTVLHGFETLVYKYQRVEDELSACILTLPSANLFAIVATTIAFDGSEVFAVSLVGATVEEWARYPLDGFPHDAQTLFEPRLVPSSQGGVVPGFSARVRINTPFTGLSVLVLIAHKEREWQQVVTIGGANVPVKKAREHIGFIDIEIPKELQGETRIGVTLVFRPVDLNPQLAFAADVPLGVKFSREMLALETWTSTLEIPLTQSSRSTDTSLDVSVTTTSPIAAPGSTVNLRINATQGSIEVAVFVVDQALLDLKPRPFPDFNSGFTYSTSRIKHYSTQNSATFSLPSSFQDAVLGSFLDRLGQVPWLCPGRDFNGQSYTSWTRERPTCVLSDLGVYADSRAWDEHARCAITQGTIGGWRGTELFGRGQDMMMSSQHTRSGGGMGGENRMQFKGAGASVMMRAQPMMAMASMSGGPPMAESVEMQDDEMAADSSTIGGIANEDSSAEPVAVIRSNFQSAPLFVGSVVLDGKGQASVPLVLPDNLGRFNVRVVATLPASTPAGVKQFSTTSTQVITQQPLNLVAAVPRIVRNGDQFLVGVSVSITDPTFKGTLQAKVVLSDDAKELLSLAPSVEENGKLRRPISVEGTGPFRVMFAILASNLNLGNADVDIQVTATPAFEHNEGKKKSHSHQSQQPQPVTDAIRVSFPVLPRQHFIMAGTSMALSMKPEPFIWPEGLSIPPLVQGSGYMSIAAGFGFAAEHHSLLARVQTDTTRPNGWDSCFTALGATSPAVLFKMYGYDSTTSQVVESNTLLVNALEALNKCTSDGIGFHYNSRYANTEPSEYTNGAVLRFTALLGHLELMQSSTSTSKKAAVSESNPVASLGLKAMSGKWVDGMNAALRRRGSNKNGYMSTTCGFGFGADVRLAMGVEWTPQQGMGDTTCFEMKNLVSEAVSAKQHPKCGLRCRVTVALILATNDKAAGTYSSEFRSIVLSTIVDGVRVQGRTAYVATLPGSKHSAGLGINAHALMALSLFYKSSMATEDDKETIQVLISKLALWVDSAIAGGSGGFGYASLDVSALGCVALATYDNAMGNLIGSGSLSVRSGNKVMLDANWESVRSGVVRTITNWTDLATPSPVSPGSLSEFGSNDPLKQPFPVLFRTMGATGELVVNTQMQFIPRDPVGGGSAVFRGILVEKVIRMYDVVKGESFGGHVDNVKPGDVVEITIQVTSPDDLDSVRIVDMAPGGLEPMDPYVSKEAQRGGSSFSSFGGNNWNHRSIPFFCFWYCPFQFQQTLKDEVIWESSRLWAGTHVVRYLARAVTVGSFGLPPTLAVAMRQPEVMGLSASIMNGYGFSVQVSKDNNAGWENVEALDDFIDPMELEKNTDETENNLKKVDSRLCSQGKGCGEVGAVCAVGQGICICPTGTKISSNEPECRGVSHSYKATSTMTPDQVPVLAFDVILQQTAALDRGRLMFDVRSAVAASFTQSNCYEVATQDVLAQVSKDGVNVIVRVEVIFWAAKLVGMELQQVRDMSRKIILVDPLDDKSGTSESFLDAIRASLKRTSSTEVLMNVYNVRVGTGTSFLADSKTDSSNGGYGKSGGTRCGGPAAVSCPTGFICAHNIYDNNGKPDSSGMSGVCVQSVPHNYNLEPPLATMVVVFFISMVVLVVGLCNRRVRGAMSRMVSRFGGGGGRKARGSDNDAEKERVRLVGVGGSGDSGSGGEESRQRKHAGSQLGQKQGGNGNAGPALEMHGLLR